jgi:hypothetical protein
MIELQNYYLPNVLFAGAISKSNLPLMESRFTPNQTDISVCVEGVCKMPETDVKKTIENLK